MIKSAEDYTPNETISHHDNVTIRFAIIATALSFMVLVRSCTEAKRYDNKVDEYSSPTISMSQCRYMVEQAVKVQEWHKNQQDEGVKFITPKEFFNDKSNSL